MIYTFNYTEQDKYTVIGDDGDKHGGRGEDGHGAASWDLGGAAEVALHGLGLLEGEGVLLDVGDEEEDPCRPYRPHSDHSLQLVHSVDRGQPPQVRCLGIVPLGDYSRFAQESACIC